MVNINRNKTVQKFEQLFKKQTGFKIFDKVSSFEKFVETVLEFNKKINFETNYENLYIVKTVEELLKIYQLRSEIYCSLGYQDEF